MTSIDFKPYLTRTLRDLPEGKKVARILAQSVVGVDPGHGVREQVKRVGDELSVGGKTYSLDRFQRVIMVSVGKASLPMSQEVANLLGDWLWKGVLITKEHPISGEIHPPSSRITVHHGGHPYPDRRSIRATEEIIELLNVAEEDDLVIFLISGGGSALLTAPPEGIFIQEVSRLNKTLLGCGASITEINTIRKHVSRVKGGQLAGLAAPSTMINLILSDVIGDLPEMIASGPTVADSTTFEEALEIIRRYHLEAKVPSSVLAHLKNGSLGKVPETPKPGDPTFKRSQTVIIGNNRKAARAGLSQARVEGFHTLHLTSSYQGEAREIGRFIAGILRQMASGGDPLPRPACLVAGGEATVTLAEDPNLGRGGRNQELALSAVQDLAGLPQIALVSFATDGNDGPTDTAGAVVTGDTYRLGLDQGLHPQTFLLQHNAYPYFDALGDLLKPGLTGTNVNDLIYLLTF